MVANHQSLLDILVLFRLFAHFKWVSKIENFRVPLIGWNMSLNRYIQLKRGDKASILQMFEHCRRTLARGKLDHDVSRGHPLAGRAPAGLQDRRLRAREEHADPDPADRARRNRERAAEARLRAAGSPPTSASRCSTRFPPRASPHESVDQLTARVRETIAKALESQPA